MTLEEAATLKQGDLVEVMTARGWQFCRVVHASVSIGTNAVGGHIYGPTWVRRPGLSKSGRRLPVWYVQSHELRRPANLDAITANVFSDWLEERGEYKAAQMLREAFPIVNANGVTP